jgi:hypothetical protein
MKLEAADHFSGLSLVVTGLVATLLGEFTQALVREKRELTGQGRKLAAERQAAREAVWQEELAVVLRQLRRKPAELARAGKSIDWKLAAAAALKARTSVINRQLATTLHRGNLHEVSRKVGAWSRQPDPVLQKKLQ